MRRAWLSLSLAVRLYTEDREEADSANLSAQFGGTGTTVSVQLIYYKRVTGAFGKSGTGRTWRSDLHGGGVDHAKSIRPEPLDDFLLAAYLRVNETPEPLFRPVPRTTLSLDGYPQSGIYGVLDAALRPWLDLHGGQGRSHLSDGVGR